MFLRLHTDLLLPSSAGRTRLAVMVAALNELRRPLAFQRVTTAVHVWGLFLRIARKEWPLRDEGPRDPNNILELVDFGLVS